MYLCQFFSLSHLIFHSARKIVENFPIERRHNWRPMRTGWNDIGEAGIAVLFLSRRETRPENLNINYFFKFLISIDFMMQIMFSDFRSAEPGLFCSFCVSLSFDIVLLSKPPPRSCPRPPAISHSIPRCVPSSSSIFDNFRFRWTGKKRMKI